MPSIAESQAAGQEKLASGQWKYVTETPAPPAIPAPTNAYPAAPNQYLRAPLPADQWQDPDAQRQFHAPAIPQTRISPLPANTNPVAGAQAASQALAIASSGGSGGVTSVALTMPVGGGGQQHYVVPVSGSPGTGIVSLAPAYVPETFGTYLGGPSQNPAGGVVDQITGNSGVSNTLLVTGVPTGGNDLAIFSAIASNGGLSGSGSFPSPGISWTQVFNNPAPNNIDGIQAYKQLSSGSSLTVSVSFSPPSGSAIWVAGLFFFNVPAGQTATVRQTSANVLDSTSGSANMSFSSNTLAGSTLVFISNSLPASGASRDTVTSDTQGNTWVNAGFFQDNNNHQITIWVAQNTAGGACTVTANLQSGTVGRCIGLYEIRNLSSISSGLPYFHAISSADIPNLDASKITTGVVSLARGGTGTDLSTSGGAHQFLAESSAHVITAVQPAFSDLSGNISTSQMNSGTSASASTFWRGDGAWVEPVTPSTGPVFVQGNSGITTTTAYLGPNNAGNTLTVMARFFNVSGGPTISDTQGNTWTLRQDITNGSSHDVYWDCVNCKGGPNTVTVSYTSTGTQVVIAEYANIARFDQITSATGTSTTGTSPNITPAANNALVIGWFSNESANGLTFTAGSGYTLRNNAQGNVVLEDKVLQTAASTNATITFSQSVNWFAGIVSYVPTGLPAEKAAVDLTAQAAAISATTLYTPATTGMYRISAYLKVTTVDATSSTLGAVTITYTDGTDSVAQTAVMLMANEAGAAVTTNSGNTTAAKLIGTMSIYALTGVAIQYAVAYASNVPGTMKYEVHLRAEAL